MKDANQALSVLAVCAVLLSHAVSAEESADLRALQANPPISQDELAREQALAARQDELKEALKVKGLPKDEAKALKAELKSVKKELSTLQKANKKGMKDHNKQVAALQKKLAKEYGLGPYPAEVADFVANKPDPLKGLYASLFIEGERNAVLNFNRLGLAAMQLGYIEHATWSFDRAIDKIEAIYADNAQAKAAKSKFSAESVKDFKGEPYERAMSYYYRGLLYLQAGDFENARAVFRAGEYQDTVSDQEEFQADFAVLNYLDGWSLACQGRSGDESFAKATELMADLAAPADGHNTLFVAELGSAPIKYGDGEYKEILKFRADARFAEQSADFVMGSPGMDEIQVPTAFATSLTWQATTRGGRPVDGILEGKAQFKDTTKAVGDTLGTIGATTAVLGAMSGDSDAALIGGGIALIGGLFSGLSNAAKPEADVRAWDNLPNNINLATGTTNGHIPDTISVNFAGEGEQVASPVSPHLIGGNDQCKIIWARARDAAAIPESSPGARLDWKTMRKRDKAAQQLDVAFRAWLSTEAPSTASGENT